MDDDEFVARVIHELRRTGRELRVPAGDKPISTPLRRIKRPNRKALDLLRAGLIWPNPSSL